MATRSFLFILLLLGPAWAGPTPTATPAAKKAAQPLSLFKKKPAAKPRASTLRYGYSEVHWATGQGWADTAEFSRFLEENYSAGKPAKTSDTDKVLGALSTAASGVFAGVAAAQWLDAQDKKGQKKDASKTDGKTLSARTI